MNDAPVSLNIDLPSSLLYQRIRAVARLLGLTITIDGQFLSLALEPVASLRVPHWSAGKVDRPELLSGTGPVPGGLACAAIFGDLRAPDLRRFGHIELPCFVVPWPARQLLAKLLDETEDDLLDLNATDPEKLLTRMNDFHAAGQTALGLSPRQYVWWSIPVIAPILRAEDPDVALQMQGETSFTHALHDAYRRVTNRAMRLRRLIELDAPSVIVDNERRMLIFAVDELLANADLDAPLLSDNDDSEGAEPEQAFDATSLFFAALGNKVVEIAERHADSSADGNSWIVKAARIGQKLGGDMPRITALWRLAESRPTEPLSDELLRELMVSGLLR